MAKQQQVSRRTTIFVFVLIGVLTVVLGTMAIYMRGEYGSGHSDDPATASCRAAYQHGGARAYHLSEDDYIAKCVQGIRDLHNSSS